MRMITACLLVTVCGCSQTQEQASFPLVTVHVKDAPFLRVPDSVTIIADSPQSRFSSVPLIVDAPAVRLFEDSSVMYCVQDVAGFNESHGTEFVDGDVIYRYTCDSLLSERQLLGTQQFRRVNAPDKYYGLYEIRPHVFAEIGTNRHVAHLNCAMHPKVRAGQQGKCPICGMDLLPVKAEGKEA